MLRIRRIVRTVQFVGGLTVDVQIAAERADQVVQVRVLVGQRAGGRVRFAEARRVAGGEEALRRLLTVQVRLGHGLVRFVEEFAEVDRLQNGCDCLIDQRALL